MNCSAIKDIIYSEDTILFSNDKYLCLYNFSLENIRVMQKCLLNYQFKRISCYFFDRQKALEMVLLTKYHACFRIHRV